VYKAKLARLHLARPLREDARVWTAKDIAQAEGDTFRQAVEIPKNSGKREALTPTVRRKTGTR
jgi:hypothetical protein